MFDMATAPRYISLPSTVRTVPVPAATGRPIVFYTPHADDETLFMGQVVADHTLAGRTVHVVVVCDGSGTGARAHLNGTGVNGWWRRRHQPAVEGYAPLTVADVVAAREREALGACAALGVPPERVHFERVPDGDITTTIAESIIVRYEAQLANPGHYTTSWVDPSHDHHVLGLALHYLNNAHPSVYGDVRYLLKRELVAVAPRAVHAGRYTPSSNAAEVQQMALNATNAYRAWSPTAGMFAIGYHSVANYFLEVEAGLPDYIHSDY